MLIAPENPSEECAKEIRATSLKKAQRKCEAISAKELLIEVLSVTQATITPYEGNYRFTCWFRSEAIPNVNDSDS
ncbi:hypothetical protein AB3R30_04395 [Leptolyngbyaceae cyanobacterium UHCC 1019]